VHQISLLISKTSFCFLTFIFSQKNVFKFFCWFKLSIFDLLEKSVPCVLLPLSRGQFYQRSTGSIYLCRSQECKKTVSCQSFLRFQDLRAQKFLVECLWNWPSIAICLNLSLRNFFFSLHFVLLFRLDFDVFRHENFDNKILW